MQAAWMIKDEGDRRFDPQSRELTTASVSQQGKASDTRQGRGKGINKEDMVIPTPNPPRTTHTPGLAFLQTRFPNSIFKDHMTVSKLSGAVVKGLESGGLMGSQVCLSSVGGIPIPPPTSISEGGREGQYQESKSSPYQGD